MRTAVLDAFQRASGGIVYWARTFRPAKGPVRTQWAWTYPASPAAGGQLRFGLFERRDGVPVEDTESSSRVMLTMPCGSRAQTSASASLRSRGLGEQPPVRRGALDRRNLLAVLTMAHPNTVGGGD